MSGNSLYAVLFSSSRCSAPPPIRIDLGVSALRLRYDQGQDAGVHARRDRVGVDALRQLDAPLERAERPLRVRPRAVVAHHRALALTAHHEPAVEDLDVEIVGRQAGKIESEHDVALADCDVDRSHERPGPREQRRERIEQHHLHVSSVNVILLCQ